MLDVSKRCTSSSMMLKATKQVRPVFICYGDTDSDYKWCLDEEKSEKYEHIESLLEKFYQTIELLSTSKYPTSNLFLLVFWRIKSALNKELPPEKTHMENIIKAMKENFSKFLGDCNLVATILDRKNHMMIVEYCYLLIYKEEVEKEITKLKEIFGEIFKLCDIERKTNENEIPEEKCAAPTSCFNMFHDETFNKFVEQTERKKVTLKSELNRYLEDSIVKVAKDVKFDILD